MRGRVFAGLVAAAGGMALLASSHYMSVAPSLAARIIGTVSLLLFVLALSWFLAPPRQRPRVRWMEYAFVAGASAVFGVTGWWALGLLPEEKMVEAARAPSLTVTEQEDGGDYFLVVENSGGQAVVWADLKIEARHGFDKGSGQRVLPGLGSCISSQSRRSRNPSLGADRSLSAHCP